MIRSLIRNYWTLGLLLFSTSTFIYSQSFYDCHYLENNKYYSEYLEIDRVSFKNGSLDPDLKRKLKNDLVQQIFTSVSSSSYMYENNLISQNSKSYQGEYYSNYEKNVNISSFGSVVDPRYDFCKIRRKRVAVIYVEKDKFQNDLFNLIQSNIVTFESSLNRVNNTYSIDEKSILLGKLRSQFVYIESALNFVASMNEVDQNKKDDLILKAGDILSKFRLLESQTSNYFDNKYEVLILLLQNQEFREIENLILRTSVEGLNAEQIRKYNEYKSDYKSQLSTYSSKLNNDIEQSIKNYEPEPKFNRLMDKLRSILFFEDNKTKYENYQKKYERKVNGLARNSFYIGINGSTIFIENQITPSSQNFGQISLGDVNYNILIPGFSFGLKTFFGNPKKRIGLVANIKTFGSKFIDLSKDQNSIVSAPSTSNNPDGELIKDFTAFQGGIIFGPFQILYGPIITDFILEDGFLTSIKFNLLRTDIGGPNFGKRNYLEFFIDGNLYSDFENFGYTNFGAGIYYNFSFNKTRKY